MTIAVVMFIFAIFMTAPGPALIGPETQYELGWRTEKTPHCRPASPAERWNRNLYPQGKAATYSLQGEYYCQTDIFRYGERDSFYDFATSHTSARIEQAVKKIAHDFSHIEMWSVRIEGTDPGLVGYLKNSFEVELARVSGQGKVARGRVARQRAGEVAVRVNRVTDPELFLEVYVLHESDLGKKLWRAY